MNIENCFFEKMNHITWFSLPEDGSRNGFRKVVLYKYSGNGQSFFTFCWPCISSQILANNQHDALFMYLFTYFISLHVSSIKCSSSGDRIVLIHHLVWLVCVKWLLSMNGIPSSHLHILVIPDDVLIQFDLLMMSNWWSKHVERCNR